MAAICRICVKETKSFHKLTEKDCSQSLSVEQCLKICVPELKLQATADPILCEQCFYNLQQAFDFKKKCLQTEEKIKMYMKENKLVKPFSIVQLYLKENVGAECSHLETKRKISENEDADNNHLKRVKVEGQHTILEEEPVLSADNNPCTTTLSPHKNVNTPEVEKPHISHSADISLVCKLCQYVADNLEMIRLHHKSTHLTHFCNICEKVFKTPAILKKHIKIHDDVREFECTICKKGYTDKSALKIHMQQHIYQRTFCCPHCPKTYVSKWNLKLHLLNVHRSPITDEELDACGNLQPEEESAQEQPVIIKSEVDESSIVETILFPVKSEYLEEETV